MSGYNRRTTPKVRDGQVQKKNRHAETPGYWDRRESTLVIEKERPGRAYRHLLKKRDILAFIEILPEWELLSRDLNTVLLAEGNQYDFGWYQENVVAISAWTHDPWQRLSQSFIDEHEGLFLRLSVPMEKRGDHVLCKFTEQTARAYQLLHVFLHELGHHNDAVSGWAKSAGDEERYANHWAFKYEKLVWDTYLRNFDL